VKAADLLVSDATPVQIAESGPPDALLEACGIDFAAFSCRIDDAADRQRQSRYSLSRWILCLAGVGLGQDRDRLLFNAVIEPAMAFVERQAAFLKIQQERWSFDAPCRCHLPGRSARRYAALLTADG
jgi:hypothetical protein